MNICVICDDYPSKKSSTFSFVKQLVDEWANLGHHCFVVSLFSVTKYKCFNKIVEKTNNPSGGSVTLIRPNYISFSTFKIFNHSLTEYFYKKALKKAFSLLPVVPDVVYGHFWGMAYCGFGYAKKNNIPLIVASGESSISAVSNSYIRNKDFCKYVSGVVCVSSKNLHESVQLGLTSEDKCIVIPNAINKKLFYRQGRILCRERLYFPRDAFIVAFVGWFDKRKGSRRVSEAIKRLNDKNIYSIFVGNGPEEPNCPNILFKGNEKHENLCNLLNCADVFVLPTLKEGCCNAIIEAMACGLPIVSSNLDFNWDILNNDNSIMVDPENIDEIAAAIKKLKEDGSLRMKMAQCAELTASQLDIQTRAKKIIDFIKSRQDF